MQDVQAGEALQTGDTRGDGPQPAGRAFLTALEVQELLHIDRSTVYRMADDGRLPCLRVGRTRRFPADQIRALVTAGSGSRSLSGDGAGQAEQLRSDDDQLNVTQGTDQKRPRSSAADTVGSVQVIRAVSQATIDVAAELLGVMMVVTDMQGTPLTHVANPCPWFTRNSAVEDVLQACIAQWRDLAADPDLTPRFARGEVGFECARTFIRSGNHLVGMVLAGGVGSGLGATVDAEFHHLDPDGRDRVLATLPKIAAAISTQVAQPTATPDKENR